MVGFRENICSFQSFENSNTRYGLKSLNPDEIACVITLFLLKFNKIVLVAYVVISAHYGNGNKKDYDMVLPT